MLNICRIEKFFKVVKVVLWLLPVLLFVWILNQNFVPGGKFEVKYDVTKDSKLLRNFASKEKDKIIGTKNKPGDNDYFQLITTTPVYFDVMVPRPFQKATVSLKYQNPDNQPVIKLGVKQANEAYYYEDMAFLHPVLENLPDYWDKNQEDDLVLWQKDQQYKDIIEELDNWQKEELEKLAEEYEIKKNDLKNSAGEEISEKDLENEQGFEIKKKLVQEKYEEELEKITEENKAEKRPKPEFATIQEFWDNFPEIDKVLEYNYNLSPYVEMVNYQKSHETIEINKSLRGKHEIYTYVGGGEDLNFVFTVQDINRHTGEDVFRVAVFNSRGEKIKEVLLPDDGEDKATGKVYPKRTLPVLLENIPHGIYRLVIDIHDDIFIKEIVTFQHLVMFKGNVYLTDNEEYRDILGDKKLMSTILYTDSTSVKVRTSHEGSLQTLRVGWENLEIDELHTLKQIDNLEGITRLVSPRNDVYIEGNGFFAFTENQLFNPNFGSLNKLDTIKDVEKYDYVFAKYPQAEEEGDWLVAKATVITPQLYIHKNNDYSINFMFNLPGLPEDKRVLKIKEVNIVFEKEPITINNFFEKLKGWINRYIKLKT